MTKKVNGIYSDRLKSIRSFVDFDYDLRKPLHSSQKAKINRYFRAIDQIQARGNKLYRSQNRNRVKAVQRAGRNEFENLPEIKVAFISSSQANPAKVRFRNGKVKISHENFDELYIEFDMRNLADDASAEIQRALKQAPRGAKWFRVNAGKFTISQPRVKDRVEPFILQLQKKYNDFRDDGKLANNNWRNWLNGITTVQTKNQTELKEFLRKESAEKQARKKRRRNAKRKQKRGNKSP